MNLRITKSFNNYETNIFKIKKMNFLYNRKMGNNNSKSEVLEYLKKLNNISLKYFELFKHMNVYLNTNIIESNKLKEEHKKMYIEIFKNKTDINLYTKNVLDKQMILTEDIIKYINNNTDKKEGIYKRFVDYSIKISEIEFYNEKDFNELIKKSTSFLEHIKNDKTYSEDDKKNYMRLVSGFMLVGTACLFFTTGILIIEPGGLFATTSTVLGDIMTGGGFISGIASYFQIKDGIENNRNSIIYKIIL
jgi:hypothetical protein